MSGALQGYQQHCLRTTATAGQGLQFCEQFTVTHNRSVAVAPTNKIMFWLHGRTNLYLHGARCLVMLVWCVLQDELAKSVTTEQGKTFQDAKGDVFRGLGKVTFCQASSVTHVILKSSATNAA